MLSIILYFWYSKTKNKNSKEFIDNAFWFYALMFDFVCPGVVSKYYNLNDTLFVIYLSLSMAGFLILFNKITPKIKIKKTKTK